MNPPGGIRVFWAALFTPKLVSRRDFTRRPIAFPIAVAVGIYVDIAEGALRNSSSHTFTIPGNNAAGARDWVLVLGVNENSRRSDHTEFSPGSDWYKRT
jgi:hypothetical protein